MKLDGMLIGAGAFLLIGLFHPIIIKCEYYFSDRVSPIFLATGLAALAASLFVAAVIPSAILGVFGCTCLWSIHELKEQTRRVEKGWFPKNPKRAGKEGNHAVRAGKAR